MPTVAMRDMWSRYGKTLFSGHFDFQRLPGKTLNSQSNHLIKSTGWRWILTAMPTDGGVGTHDHIESEQYLHSMLMFQDIPDLPLISVILACILTLLSLTTSCHQDSTALLP
jgi:hypothetical protein